MNFDVIIVEGLLTLYKEELLAKLDLKIFLETDDDVRLSRRGFKLFRVVY
jgi:uridine kinase